MGVVIECGLYSRASSDRGNTMINYTQWYYDEMVIGERAKRARHYQG